MEFNMGGQVLNLTAAEKEAFNIKTEESLKVDNLRIICSQNPSESRVEIESDLGGFGAFLVNLLLVSKEPSKALKDILDTAVMLNKYNFFS